MDLLARLLRGKPETEAQRQARRDWRSATAPEQTAPLETLRWVAVDTESSGLDPYRDRLISLGACAGRGAALNTHDSFEGLLRQEQASPRANVLVHGIGHAAQAAGEPPEQALAAYLRYARADVIVGYHALFDRTLLARAVREHLGLTYRPVALDVAVLLPALEAVPGTVGWELDRWLERFGVRAYARHDALADAFATAQLFLVVLARAREARLDRLSDLLKVQKTALELQTLQRV